MVDELGRRNSSDVDGVLESEETVESEGDAVGSRPGSGGRRGNTPAKTKDKTPDSYKLDDGVSLPSTKLTAVNSIVSSRRESAPVDKSYALADSSEPDHELKFPTLCTRDHDREKHHPNVLPAATSAVPEYCIPFRVCCHFFFHELPSSGDTPARAAQRAAQEVVEEEKGTMIGFSQEERGNSRSQAPTWPSGWTE